MIELTKSETMYCVVFLAAIMIVCILMLAEGVDDDIDS
jgi:hypothetical protein